MGIAMGGLLQGVNEGARLGMQINEAEAKRKRQETLQAREDQAYQEQQDLKAGVKSAMQDVAPVQGEAMVNPNPAVEPSKYEDPSVYNSDVRELRRGGALAETRPATWVGAKEVAPAEAQLTAGTQNAQASKLERVASVYAEAGKMDEAMKYKKMAEDARNEGADKFIDGVMGRAPSLDAVGKAPVFVPIDTASQDTFNAAGKLKIPPGAQIKYIKQMAPDGSHSFVDAQVVDKDGNPLHGGTLKQYQWMMATNPVQRQQVERQGTLDQVNAANVGADNKRADRALAMQEENAKLNKWATENRIDIDRKRLENDETYRNGMLDVQRAQVEAKQRSLEERMSPAHKAALTSMDKQQASLEDQVKSTQDALIKGITGGTFQETDENGKPTKEAAAIQRTLKNLETQIGSIAMRRADIMKQYETEGTATSRDPLGLRGGDSRGGGTLQRASSGRETVPSDVQARRDAESLGPMRDELEKARKQLAEAKTPDERSRIEDDIKAIERELGGRSKTAAPAGTLKSSAPSAPAASAPAPSPSPAPAAAPAPATKAEAAKPPASSLESWAQNQKAAEQSRRDDPELKRLQAAVDNASGRQIHAAKKALEDYRKTKGS